MRSHPVRNQVIAAAIAERADLLAVGFGTGACTGLGLGTL